jgi:REP element-mobilizing transposase RayT
MANNYLQLYTHAIFVVKFRRALLQKSFRDDLFHVIGNLINETGCQSLQIGGVEDHIHCLFKQNPKVPLSKVMQSVKAKSSKWINESNFLDSRFEWQRGYALFSCSSGHTKNLIRYIENQEEHHKKKSFRSEYVDLLEEFEVDYDERYILRVPD